MKGPGGALLLALTLTACGTVSDMFSREASWVPRVKNPFEFSDFQVFGGGNNKVTRPVTPEDLVDSAGYCTARAPAAVAEVATEVEAAPRQPPPSSQAPADGPMVLTTGAASAPPPATPRTVAAADPAVAAVPSGEELAPTAPLLPGGIALKMTECEVVRRAGHPEKVEIATDVHGERTAVLTYVRGERPGIYHFVAGRLKEITRAPEPPRPPPTRKRQKRSKRRA